MTPEPPVPPASGACTVGPDARGERLDAWLARAHPHHSRARWQTLIREDRVRLNGRVVKPNHKLAGGEALAWEEPAVRPVALEPENRTLDILHEDGDLLVLNKPAGLVVHPAPGHEAGTLVNALLHHCGDSLAGIGGEQRPGIVHRLDKDTSGLLVIAKTEAAQRALVDAFKARTVHKTYLALAWGVFQPRRGTIRTLIGRSPHHRQKMSARVQHGREAVTHYEVVEAWPEVALVRLGLETGRTHQIRVHLAHVGHPIVGDTLYGRARHNHPAADAPRQMLHAARLEFTHPRTGKALVFEAPLPPDMQSLIAQLGKPD